MQPGARSERASGDARRRSFCPRLRAGDVARSRGQALNALAEHQLDDPLLGADGHVNDADGLAFPEHGRPVADGGDLDQPVRDEDDGSVAAMHGLQDFQDPLGEVRGQGGGHLVEHQYIGLDREGAGEVDDPQRGQRHLAG